MAEGIVKTDVQIFQVVLDLQNFITRIPGQVERQQPVYLIDALGRHQPFHLEFILSATAFKAVLMSNFENIGSGARKIDNGEFAIQDSVMKRDIDLSAPWKKRRLGKGAKDDGLHKEIQQDTRDGFVGIYSACETFSRHTKTRYFYLSY